LRDWDVIEDLRDGLELSTIELEKRFKGMAIPDIPERQIEPQLKKRQPASGQLSIMNRQDIATFPKTKISKFVLSAVWRQMPVSRPHHFAGRKASDTIISEPATPQAGTVAINPLLGDPFGTCTTSEYNGLSLVARTLCYRVSIMS
jgi:hypothetical protein